MFFEIDPELLKQTDPGLNKRWFRDAGTECDLLVWENQGSEIERFQFWHQEALIEWDESVGIKTGHVDKSSGSFTHYQSDLYRMHSGMDNDIVTFVTDLLANKVSGEGELIQKIFGILIDISQHSN